MNSYPSPSIHIEIEPLCLCGLTANDHTGDNALGCNGYDPAVSKGFLTDIVRRVTAAGSFTVDDLALVHLLPTGGSSLDEQIALVNLSLARYGMGAVRAGHETTFQWRPRD